MLVDQGAVALIIVDLKDLTGNLQFTLMSALLVKNSITICSSYILSSPNCLYYFQQSSIFGKCKPSHSGKKDILPNW